MGSNRVLVAAGAVAVAALMPPGAASADPPAPAPTPAPVPATSIEQDGLYAVGSQIAPGTYTSAGPVEGTKCYWRRVGADNATLDNAMSSTPQVVAIDATDAAFKTRGCQPWQLTDGVAPAPETPPWLAQLQMRHYLDMLNGLAGQSGNGQLPPS